MALIPPGLLPERVRTLINSLLDAKAGLAANTFTEVQTLPVGGLVIGTVKVLAGTGDPDAVVTAPIGSLFLRSDGGASTTLYVKESGTGSSGWVAK